MFILNHRIINHHIDHPQNIKTARTNFASYFVIYLWCARAQLWTSGHGQSGLRWTLIQSLFPTLFLPVKTPSTLASVPLLKSDQIYSSSLKEVRPISKLHGCPSYQICDPRMQELPLRRRNSGTILILSTLPSTHHSNSSTLLTI